MKPKDLRLETERLILRELRADDWPQARVLDSDPEVVRFQTYDVLDEAGTKTYLEKALREAAQTPRTLYELALCGRSNDLYLGRAGLKLERPEHREAVVWFQLRRDHWGQGYATEALRALIDFAFDTLGLHRVFGDCDPR